MKLFLKKRGKKGFTLVELVIVIAILAILAAVAIPTVIGVINSANQSTDAANARAIEAAVKLYVADQEKQGNEITDFTALTAANYQTALNDSGITSMEIKQSGKVFYFNTTTERCTVEDENALAGTKVTGYDSILFGAGGAAPTT